MKTIRISLIALGLALAFHATQAAEIHPAATPDDGLDDTAAIQAAIDAAADGDTIVFQPGQYDLVASASPSQYDALLTIIGRHNLTLRGAVDAEGNPTTRWRYRYRHGAGMEFHQTLHVEDSSGITIQNLLYDAPGVIPAGRIVEIGADFTTIELFDDSLGDAWGSLYPVGSYSSPAGHQGSAAWEEGSRHVFSRLPTDPVTADPVEQNRLRINGVFTGSGIGDGRPAAVGDHACFGPQVISGVDAKDGTFSIYDSKDVLIENVRGRDASPRFIIMVGNENITLRNVVLDAAIEGSNRGCAATRDGVIGFHNIGHVEWDGVKVYSFTGDDNAAIANKMITLSGSGLTKTVTLWGSHPEDRQRLVGSKVWAVNADYQWPGDDQFALITAVAPDASTITFDRPIPGYFDGAGIAVEGRNAETMIIRNCEFLIRFRQNNQHNTLFENNIFREVAAIARYVNGNFFNGGPVRGGLELRGNHFLGSLQFSEFNLPATAPGYHRNVQVHDNFFYGNNLTGSGFSESSLTDNVWMTGSVNVSIGNSSDPATVTVSGNRQVSAPPDPSSPPAAPTGLTATATSSRVIDLSWTDNAANELFFYLERSVAGGAFEVLTILPANATTYTDRALKPDTTYSYRLRAYNDSGFSAPIESDTATLPVALTAPAIVTQPANIEAQAGASVSFSVAATGGALTYAWTRDGQPVGANAPTLELASVQAADVGNYAVTVSNSEGSVTSQSAQLSVVTTTVPTEAQTFEAESLPATTSDSLTTFNDAVASGGQGIKLNADAVGDNVEFTLTVPTTAEYAVGYRYKSFSTRGIGQLSINGSDLGDPVNQVGSTGFLTADAGVLSFTAGTHLFRLRVVGSSSGSYDLTIDTITLTPTAPPVALPEITTQPQSSTIASGQALSLSVAATDSGILNYQWLRNGAPVGENSPTLDIPNTTTADSGTYTVRVAADVGVVSSAVALVSVVEPYAYWQQGFDWKGADSSPLGDANGDTIPNLIAYALDTNPLEPFPPALFPSIAFDTSAADGPWLQFLYRENTAATDLHYDVISSTDLNKWDSVIIDGIQAIKDIADADPEGDGTARLVRVSIQHDANLTPRMFLQLQLTTH